MSLEPDFDISFLGQRGRRPAVLEVEVVRPVRKSDLAAQAAAPTSPAEPIKKLRARHHSAARLLAAGMTEGEVSIATGFDNAYLSNLKNDPSFADLIAHYSSQAEERFFDVVDGLAGLSQDAMTILKERLEEAPEEFSVSQLKDLLVVGLDRTGFGPTAKQEVTHTVELGKRLDAARKRALEARRAAIDITPEEDE